MKRILPLRVALVALAVLISNATSESTSLRSRSRFLVRQESRQLGSWWDNLLYHLGPHKRKGGSGGSISSGGSESSAGNGGSSSGSNGSSSNGDEEGNGGDNGNSDGGGDGGGDGQNDGGDEADAGSSGGGNDYDNNGGESGGQSNSDTGDNTSNEDVNGGLGGIVSSRKNSLYTILMLVCGIVGLIAAVVAFLLWRVKSGNQKSVPPPPTQTDADDDVYKLMWAPQKSTKRRAKTPPPSRKSPLRSRTPTRERTLQQSRREPLIDTSMEYGNDDDSDSSSSNNYSVPRETGVSRVLDDHSGSEEDSCDSVYTGGPEQEDEASTTCSQTAMSTDEESAPMDEAADRKKAQTAAVPPTPMDEQAIDATIRRNLMVANEIIKNQSPRSDIPFIAGLTELDNV